MVFKWSLALLLGVFLLSACSGTPQPAQATLPVSPTAEPTQSVLASPGYPAPGSQQPSSAYPYPAPVQPTPAPWEPKPGDETMQRAEVAIDKSEIIILESFPPQYRLHLVGSLPTPCHELRVAVSELDTQNRLNVEVYSVVDPSKACVQVLQPFDENIPLGSYSPGRITVWVNGEEVKAVAP